MSRPSPASAHAPTLAPTHAPGTGQTARCLRIIELLCGHALDGMSNKELAAALQTSPANISRDVSLLNSLGWAETLENGRYSVTVKPLAVMRLYQLHISDVTARAEHFDRRISAKARQLAD